MLTGIIKHPMCVQTEQPPRLSLSITSEDKVLDFSKYYQGDFDGHQICLGFAAVDPYTADIIKEAAAKANNNPTSGGTFEIWLMTDEDKFMRAYSNQKPMHELDYEGVWQGH